MEEEEEEAASQDLQSHISLAAGLLRELGYSGALSTEEALLQSCKLGAACSEFAALCVWLVLELKSVSFLVETVSPTEGPEDAETFQLEISGVMNELRCPYSSLTTGNVTSRLHNLQNCLTLIVFLSTELQAARILNRRRASASKSAELQQDVLSELQLIRKTLDLPDISPESPLTECMKGLEDKVTERTSAVPISPPLLKTPLKPEQWETLQELHGTMLGEYECRIRMLVTRFDVTVQSFHWSERAKVQGTSMNEVFWPIRKSLVTESHITIPHLLAAREDYSRILHTCNAAFCQNTRTAIQKVLMTGHVPDRGGRPNEIEPPMPSFHERREGGGGHQRWGKRNKRKRN
ncbi:protein FAM98C [Gastrophryne carolinensis]